MSIEAISAVLHHSAASGTSRAVLMALAWHIGDDPSEGCYPSQTRIAKMSGCSKRQVQRALMKLEEINEIEISQHDGDGYRSDRITNRYWIRLDCPSDCDSSLSHQRGVKKDATGRRKRRNGVSYMTQRDGVDVVLKVI